MKKRRLGTLLLLAYVFSRDGGYRASSPGAAGDTVPLLFNWHAQVEFQEEAAALHVSGCGLCLEPLA